jgi:hypothetical protein
MTDFGWWQAQAGTQGMVMCCLCFDYITPDKMWVDESGYMHDVCAYCKAMEDAEMERRRERGEYPFDRE